MKSFPYRHVIRVARIMKDVYDEILKDIKKGEKGSNLLLALCFSK